MNVDFQFLENVKILISFPRSTNLNHSTNKDRYSYLLLLTADQVNLIVKKITGLFRFQIIKKIEEEERDPIGKTIEIKAAEATTKSYQVVNLLILISHFLKKLKNLTRDQV